MIHFDDVKPLVLNFIKGYGNKNFKYYILRDVFGKISIYLLGEEVPADFQEKLVSVIGKNWSGTVRTIENENPLFKEIENSIEKVSDNIFYGERPLVKKIWGNVTEVRNRHHGCSKVVTFYSYKGGVGRTTALVLAALSLVREGKKVITVDFDLEAPGLGTLLNIEEGFKKPDYGVVDFLVEYDNCKELIDIDDYVYPITSKQLTGLSGGELLVMQAANLESGSQEEYYNKLSRIDFNMPKFSYNDNPIERLISLLEDKYHPDFIFMDSRAGIHDIGGLMLLRYSDEVVPIFYGNEQNMIGLRFVLPKLIRSDISFYLVNSPMPVAEEEAEEELNVYLKNSLECLEKSGYFDDIPDLYDESSMHYPLNVKYNVLTTNINSDSRLVQLLDSDGTENTYYKLAHSLLSNEDMEVKEQYVVEEDKRGILEAIRNIKPANTGSAENEFETFEELKKNFYPLQEYRYIYDNSKFLITGSKGSGKTALFKVLQCPEYAKALAQYIGNLSMEDIYNTEWITGFDQDKDYPDRSNIIAIGKTLDREIYFIYWKMLAIKVMERYIRQYFIEIPLFIEDIFSRRYSEYRFIMEKYDNIDEKMSEVFEQLDICLIKEKKVLILTYDKLDRGLDTKYRGDMVSELINFWSENNIRLKNIKSKIFLRNDIFKNEVKGVTDKIKLNNYRANIEWSYDYLLAMVWKRMMEKNSSLKLLFQNAIERGGYFLSVNEQVGIVPKPQKEINQICLEELTGNKMGKGNKAYTYNWISYRLSDTNEKIVPRSILKLFSVAAQNEIDALMNDTTLNFAKILRPRSLEDALNEVSEDRLEDLAEEYPEFRRVFYDLKNYCGIFPADEKSLYDALIQCGLAENNIKVYVDQLKDIGVLKEYQRKKSDSIRYHIPDIYLKGMKLVRKGIR